MALRFTYIIVEGPHDEAFVGGILRKGPHKFHYLERKSDVDSRWHSLIPSNYPVGKPPNDFLQRVPMPSFYQNDTHSVAIQSANGIDKIVNLLEETFATPEFLRPDSLGIVLDSDSTEAPDIRASSLAAKVNGKIPDLTPGFPTEPGNVVSKPSTDLRAGQFVLPDNSSPGTLEDVLISAGRIVYPTLIRLAENHVNAAKQSLVAGIPDWKSADSADFRKPTGPQKALVASATAILKPGKTCQVTLRDNRWIDPTTMAVSPLKEFVDWLHLLVI